MLSAMPKPMNTKDVKELLHLDHVSCSKGVFKVKKEFYYRHGFSSEKLAEYVKAKIPAAVIECHGEVDKPFKGGASISNSSHFWVTFSLPKE